MLKLVNDSKKVKKFYTEFLDLLENKNIFSEHLSPFRLGFKGGEAADEACYSPNLRIWVSAGSVHWNAFGLNKTPSMVVQMNFQDYDDKPQRRGAAFALDKYEEPVVVHRGHIGGGRAGIGLNLMLDQCRSERAILTEEGLESECFVVGQLRSEFFAQQLADFVQEVHRVKNLTTTTEIGLGGIVASLLKLDDRWLFKEKAGTQKRVGSKEVSLIHGLVVNELAGLLETVSTKRGWQLRNDRHRDLMLLDNHKLRAVS